MKKTIGILCLVISLLVGCESGEKREVAKSAPAQNPVVQPKANVWGGKTFPVGNGCVALKADYVSRTVLAGNLISYEYGSDVTAKVASEFLVKSCAAANLELSCGNEDCLYTCTATCMSVTVNQLSQM